MLKWIIGTHGNWKNKNPRGSFGATCQTALPIQSIWPIFAVNRLNWQCCLAGSSKTAPRILIFSTAIGAKPSFYMKFIVIYAPAFFGYNNPVLATVPSLASVTLVQSNPFPQQTSSSATPIGGILHGSSSIGHPGELVSAIWGQPERLPTLRLYTPA